MLFGCVKQYEHRTSLAVADLDTAIDKDDRWFTMTVLSYSKTENA